MVAQKSKRRPNSIGNIFLKIVLFIVFLGLLIALLRVFNYDPFGIISWVFNIFSKIVLSIADFLTGNAFFKKVVSNPSLILFF